MPSLSPTMTQVRRMHPQHISSIGKHPPSLPPDPNPAPTAAPTVCLCACLSLLKAISPASAHSVYAAAQLPCSCCPILSHPTHAAAAAAACLCPCRYCCCLSVCRATLLPGARLRATLWPLVTSWLRLRRTRPPLSGRHRRRDSSQRSSSQQVSRHQPGSSTGLAAPALQHKAAAVASSTSSSAGLQQRRPSAAPASSSTAEVWVSRTAVARTHCWPRVRSWTATHVQSLTSCLHASPPPPCRQQGCARGHPCRVAGGGGG